MKKKLIKLFTEAPIWNDDRETTSPSQYETVPGAGWTPEERAEREKELQHYDKTATIDGGDYIYSVYENEDTIFVVARVKNSKEPLVGEIFLDKDKKYPYPVVQSVFNIEAHRGKGIGNKFYSIIVDRFGGVISDRSLSGAEGKGSFQLWQKLAQQYPAYLLMSDKGKVTKQKVKEFDPKQVMGLPNIRLMVSKK
jgi:hypothetical protein